MKEEPGTLALKVTPYTQADLLDSPCTSLAPVQCHFFFFFKQSCFPTVLVFDTSFFASAQLAQVMIPPSVTWYALCYVTLLCHDSPFYYLENSPPVRCPHRGGRATAPSCNTQAGAAPEGQAACGAGQLVVEHRTRGNSHTQPTLCSCRTASTGLQPLA